MMIAAVLPLFVGLIGAAAAELKRLMKIYDERDVNYFLGVPVVALIPESLTTSERGHAQRELFKRRLLLLAAGAAAVPLIAYVLNATSLFQMLGSK